MKDSKVRQNYWFEPLVMVLAFTLCCAVPALAGGSQETIKSLVEEAMAIIKNPSLQSPGQKEQRVALVEKAAARYFDYGEMAKHCLGDTWGNLNTSQQDEFVSVFTALLKASFVCRIDELAKAQVSYQAEIVKRDYTEVPITILRPNDKIPVSFRMIQKPQGWMIYDLVIQGVSLDDNYRSQFGQVIRGASYKELIRRLQAKIKEECKP